ncbi:hypothetical protein [Phaffia rhodozyma]|uniref:DDH domain-containing protein n=1 Tax=Phaffia rhodozyma TaxID=264483 RepID=A0A0F7SNP9_PHARH|nr:hypothetical protein [Phaffia rhodozyma]
MSKRSASPSFNSVSVSASPNKSIKLSPYADWPAPRESMERAKSFLRDCVQGSHRVVLIPDKDADGLSSTLILYRTLLMMASRSESTSSSFPTPEIFFLPKGANVHSLPPSLAQSYSRVIALDQGSRAGPPLLPGPTTKCLIIDHHYSDMFPDEAAILSACKSEPVATSSMLTYMLCCELDDAVKDTQGESALIGVYGDLGAGTVKFGKDEPWPSWLAEVEKKSTKSKLSKVVSMLNAPRRTPDFDVEKAWDVMFNATSLSDIISAPYLLDCRARTTAETARWQSAGPKFSKDGRIAVIAIHSGYQVHPLIATRWAGTLKTAKDLVLVMCTNDLYTPGKTHFSCRVPKSKASSASSPSDSSTPNLIEILNTYKPQCEAVSPGWIDRVGGDYARGHREASGGIIGDEEFRVLMEVMEIGVKSDEAIKREKEKERKAQGQKNTLDGYFKPGPGAKPNPKPKSARANVPTKTRDTQKIVRKEE